VSEREVDPARVWGNAIRALNQARDAYFEEGCPKPMYHRMEVAKILVQYEEEELGRIPQDREARVREMYGWLNERTRP